VVDDLVDEFLGELFHQVEKMDVYVGKNVENLSAVFGRKMFPRSTSGPRVARNGAFRLASSEGGNQDDALDSREKTKKNTALELRLPT